MPHAEHRTFESPDEVRRFEKGRLELLEIGGGVVGRLVLEPGWRWSKHVKPLAGTELCEAPHSSTTRPARSASRWPTATSSTPARAS